MSEPTTLAAAGGAVVSAAVVRWFGVEPPSIIAAAFGAVLALHLSTAYETKLRALASAGANFGVGIYGGQWMHTLPLFVGTPQPVLCGLAAALGVALIPSIKEAIQGVFKRWGGGNV